MLFEAAAGDWEEAAAPPEAEAPLLLLPLLLLPLLFSWYLVL